MNTDINTWTRVKLEQIAKCQGGSAFSPALQGKKTGAIPFFKVSDMNLPENRWFMKASNNYVDETDVSSIIGAAKPECAVVFPKVGAAVHTNKKRMLTRRSFIDNNVMAVWSTDPTRCRPGFLYLYFLSINLSDLSNPGPLPSINNSKVYEREVLLPSPEEQDRMFAAIMVLQNALEVEEKAIVAARELKQSALDRFFTSGLRSRGSGSAEVDSVPPTWVAESLDECCRVVSSSMTYTQLSAYAEPSSSNADVAGVMGIKVSDMNLPGNEIEIRSANLQRTMPIVEARRRSVPPHVVVFPKRGAAIATNKKRMTSAWTVLDPNLIAVEAGEGIDPKFLYQWFQRFDLRSITEPGPTPQLNKKNLLPLLVPHPRELAEQREIAGALEGIDTAIASHEKKRSVLSELLFSMLHGLMTGEIRVDNCDIDISEVANAQLCPR
jgi:type I restriction enzyme S subunit